MVHHHQSRGKSLGLRSQEADLFPLMRGRMSSDSFFSSTGYYQMRATAPIFCWRVFFFSPTPIFQNPRVLFFFVSPLCRSMQTKRKTHLRDIYLYNIKRQKAQELC